MTSTVATSDVLLMFNNPGAEASVRLMARLSEESKTRGLGSQENLGGGGGSGSSRRNKDEQPGGAGSGGSGGAKKGSKGEVDESYINSGESE